MAIPHGIGMLAERGARQLCISTEGPYFDSFVAGTGREGITAESEAIDVGTVRIKTVLQRGNR